jgi:hypothetical protein
MIFTLGSGKMERERCADNASSNDNDSARRGIVIQLRNSQSRRHLENVPSKKFN